MDTTNPMLQAIFEFVTGALGFETSHETNHTFSVKDSDGRQFTVVVVEERSCPA